MSTKTPCGNKFCGKTGLMLLPLRYAVAASEEGHAEFPELSGTLGQGVTDKKLRTAAYTVRMMRQGFLYVMTKRSGKLKWESAWAVNHQGYISRIALGDAVQPPEFTCTTKGDDINASMISIEKAQDVSEFRVLFMPDPLSKAALSKIESDSKLYNKLQKFQAKAVVQPHALQPGDLRSKVVEFRSIEGGERKLAPRFNDHMYPFFGAEAKLVKNEPYPYTGRLKNLSVELLNKKGMAIVLHDPLGLAQELNTWRNLSIGRLHTVMTAESTVFARYTNEQLMSIIRTVNAAEEQIRNGAISRREPKLGVALDDLAKEAKTNPKFRAPDLRGIPYDSIYKNREEYESKKQEWRRKYAQEIGDDAWKKYGKRLWPKSSYNAVLKSFEALGDVCDQKNEERAQDLMPWLNAPLLHDTLAFYDDQHFESGVAYAGQMGFCVHGLNSCSIGQDWLIKQVEQKDLKPSTLMFNAGMLNYQAAAKAYVAKGGLSDALSPYEKIQEAGKGISDMWSKIKDLAEKLETVAHVSGVSTAHLGGVNLLLLQLGHAGLARMPGGKLLDKQVLRASVVHRLLSLSLGKIISKDLAVAYPNPAAFDAKSVAAAKAQRNQINQALTAASKSNSMNGLRFGSVVAMLEMMNVMMKAGKLGEKPAQREAWELLAASLGLGAVMLELTGSVCEKIGASRNPALISGSKVGVGALKLASGGLGAVAGIIGAFVDFDNYGDVKEKNRKLAAVYFLRGVVSTSGAIVGAGITLGASGPFLEWLLQRANGPLYKEALKLALRASARLAAERMALLLLRGARLFTVVGIGLTVAIWIFSDNALESWCDKSCLRKDRKAGGFGSVAEESAALDAAVLEVS